MKYEKNFIIEIILIDHSNHSTIFFFKSDFTPRSIIQTFSK